MSCNAIKPEMFETSGIGYFPGAISKSTKEYPKSFVCPQCVTEFNGLFILCCGFWYKFRARVLLHAAFLHRVKVMCRCKDVLEVKDLLAHRRRCFFYSFRSV
ncbi:uncharacterized protein LOC100903767 [Galendromus occidentalis]|uniref:Uncharacterized protein LOC100903767 n=1 Tax=Galendromus occidentalis TaxID=34638 RepID=A0AAJ6QYM9_9ACAR|nr:uncharacterized protein LOC100903767 [Galendromus occidentalis]